MADRIGAAVVTFDRKELLVRCLDGLRLQPHPLEVVVVVDNASSDGTEDYLRRRGYLDTVSSEKSSEYRGVIRSVPDGKRLIEFVYVRLPRNVGSAGGFAQAIQRVYDSQCDWIWTMDDDVVPLPGAVETLTKYGSRARCVQSRRQATDGRPVPWPQRFDATRIRSVYQPNSEPLMGGEDVYVDSCCFEGLFLHREVVERIGVPDPRYFIILDDSDYGLRLAAQHRILYPPEIVMARTLESQVRIQSVFGTGIHPRSSEAPWKSYFAVRNLFLFRERNPRGAKQLIYLVARLVRFFASAVVYFDKTSGSRLRFMIRGFLDGMRGRFGAMQTS